MLLIKLFIYYNEVIICYYVFFKAKQVFKTNNLQNYMELNLPLLTLNIQEGLFSDFHEKFVYDETYSNMQKISCLFIRMQGAAEPKKG